MKEGTFMECQLVELERKMFLGNKRMQVVKS